MTAPEPGAGRVDFDLHGFVGVRVADPQPGDAEVVRRQLGPLERSLQRAPDIVVRFVDRLDDQQPVTFATWPDGGWTDRGFYVLRGKAGVPVRTLLPLDDVGVPGAGPVEIVCERGNPQVPHLLAVVNIVALSHGVLPLHASAFTYQGTGVLVTGWAKGGKTETLLAFARRGADYVGDEWVYLTPDGGMHGVPEPVRLWDWHLRQLGDARPGLPAGRRVRVRATHLAAQAAARLGSVAPAGAGASLLRRAAPVLQRQAYVQVPPAELFGPQRMTLHGRVDIVVLALSHDAANIRIEHVDGAEIAARMLASLAEERAPFLSVYRQFRFAFPHRPCPAIEAAAEAEEKLLNHHLAGRRAYLLRHPYPVDLVDLTSPIESVLTQEVGVL